MEGSSSDQDHAWARAIHAVVAQKMRLRNAAQQFGVPHLALHRRVHELAKHSSFAAARDFQLSDAEVSEVVHVLHEQFRHDQQVSSEDVRFVVRTIASHDGQVDVPSRFPNNRWITAFRQLHHLEVATDGIASDDSQHSTSDPVSNAIDWTTMSPSSNRPDIGEASVSTSDAIMGEEESFDISSSSESSVDTSNHRPLKESRACSPAPLETAQVPPEIWQQAMDAINTQGMSLRAAAREYGVHFAALYRRLKKRERAQQQAAFDRDARLPFEDEVGIVRVIHARAELGVMMTFRELIELVNRTARKYWKVTPQLSRSLLHQFRSRSEASISHLISGWPLPSIRTLYPSERGLST